MKNYIIKFDLFEAAMAFVGDDCEPRYYLRGVRLIGNRIEATNGHIGYMAKTEKGNELPKQISGLTVFPDVIVKPKNKLPLKTKKNCISYCSITLGDTARIDYLDFFGEIIGSDILEVIDGRFPNLAELFVVHKKQDKVDEFFGVNAEYLAIFSKILKREKFPAVVFHPKASDKSIVVEFCRPHVSAKERAIIMPVRIDRNG